MEPARSRMAPSGMQAWDWDHPDIRCEVVLRWRSDHRFAVNLQRHGGAMVLGGNFLLPEVRSDLPLRELHPVLQPIFGHFFRGARWSSIKLHYSGWDLDKIRDETAGTLELRQVFHDQTGRSVCAKRGPNPRPGTPEANSPTPDEDEQATSDNTVGKHWTISIPECE